MHQRMLSLWAAGLVWTCLIGSRNDVMSGEPQTMVLRDVQFATPVGASEVFSGVRPSHLV